MTVNPKLCPYLLPRISANTTWSIFLSEDPMRDSIAVRDYPANCTHGSALCTCERRRSQSRRGIAARVRAGGRPPVRPPGCGFVREGSSIRNEPAVTTTVIGPAVARWTNQVRRQKMKSTDGLRGLRVGKGSEHNSPQAQLDFVVSVAVASTRLARHCILPLRHPAK